MPANKGARHHAAKLTEPKVRAARKSIESGKFIVVDGKRQPVTVSALARKYGVSISAMRMAVSGETWRHVT